MIVVITTAMNTRPRRQAFPQPEPPTIPSRELRKLVRGSEIVPWPSNPRRPPQHRREMPGSRFRGQALPLRCFPPSYVASRRQQKKRCHECESEAGHVAEASQCDFGAETNLSVDRIGEEKLVIGISPREID